MKLRYERGALADLEEICAYIAADSREAAGRIRAVMGWNDEQAAAELEAFETEREAFLRKPPRMEATLLAAAD